MSLSCRICKKVRRKMMVLQRTNNGKKLKSIWMICRSCMQQKQIKYAKTAVGRRKMAEATRRAYRNHKEKWIARSKARYAVKKGIIKKPEACEVCEKIKTLQGHHEDYSKPLQVIWLCFGCHADAHRIIKSTQPL